MASLRIELHVKGKRTVIKFKNNIPSTRQHTTGYYVHFV